MTDSASSWDGSYQGSAPAPWDIGRPQPEFATLAARGALAGDLLDAGCGTGEHTLLAAEHGATAYGVDLSPVAIARARAKNSERGLDARFDSGDILTMPLPEVGFDVVLDSGLFHVFDDADRTRYVAALARTSRPGGTCYLMCFSDRQPGDWGPRRVSRAEIESAFADRWTVEEIRPAVFEINPMSEASTVDAWFVALRRG